MSASGDSHFDLNPIKAPDEERLLDMKQGAKEIKPVLEQINKKSLSIQQRITECRKRIRYAVEEDLPAVAKIIEEREALRQRIESTRDANIKIIDDIISEIETEINELPKTEKMIDHLKELEEEKLQAIENKDKVCVQSAIVLTELGKVKDETIRTTHQAIIETINIGRQIIQEDSLELASLQEEEASLKKELISLQEEERRFTLSYGTLCYFTAPNKSTSNLTTSEKIPQNGPNSSPRLNGGP